MGVFLRKRLQLLIKQICSCSYRHGVFPQAHKGVLCYKLADHCCVAKHYYSVRTALYCNLHHCVLLLLSVSNFNNIVKAYSRLSSPRAVVEVAYRFVQYIIKLSAAAVHELLC